MLRINIQFLGATLNKLEQKEYAKSVIMNSILVIHKTVFRSICRLNQLTIIRKMGGGYMYISVEEACNKWNITRDALLGLLNENKIFGAVLNKNNEYEIPMYAENPYELSNKNLLDVIDQKLKQLNKLRELCFSEKNRFLNDFSIENTFNSNAIEGSTLTLRETVLSSSRNHNWH
nr:hypothetical protein [Mycoplasmopsis bovis]